MKLFEKYLFLLLVLIHLFPVLSVKFFVTLDGPSHTNNASLVLRLIKGDGVASGFFRINSEPEPNWSGHALMAFMNQFYSSRKAEKIYQVLCICIFLVFFRKLVLTVNPKAAWASYLAFPFAYSLPFHFGFYNFCFGLALLFFSQSYFLSVKNKLTVKNSIILFLLATVLYFSHLFIISAFMLFAFVFSVNRNLIFHPGKAELKKAAAMALPFLPALFLMINFLLKKKVVDEEFNYSIPFAELTEWLLHCRPLITLVYESEMPFSTIISCALGLLLAVALWHVLVTGKSRFNRWALFTIVLLAGYYFIPDGLASGSFISIRLLLLFCLFLMVWLSTVYIPKSVRATAVAATMAVSFYFLYYHYGHAKNLGNDAGELFSVTEKIENGSVVLPLNYSANWLHSNISGYIGAEKNIIILDNYEAAKPQFPVKWKEGMNPYKLLGNFSGRKPPCADIGFYEKATGKKIDYVITWHYSESKDSCQVKTDSLLRENFHPVFSSPEKKAILYRREKF